PSVGQFLAELGCEVIKVESPSGDVTRTWYTGKHDPQPSSYFQGCNLGKKGVALTLNKKGNTTKNGLDDDYDHLLKLVSTADIVLASYKPGDAKKLGVDFETLRAKANSVGLIYAQITGYGDAGYGDQQQEVEVAEDGHEARTSAAAREEAKCVPSYVSNTTRPGYDACIQAEAGWMHLNGEADGPPTKMPVALMDLLAAHQLKQAILLALYEREKCRTTSRGGASQSPVWQGKFLSVSLLRAAVCSLANQGSAFLLSEGKTEPKRRGSDHPSIVPYGTVFYDKARKPFVLAVGTDTQFRKL
ncbi:unnamed protein product, partial [Amoebophrya sp. A25]